MVLLYYKLQNFVFYLLNGTKAILFILLKYTKYSLLTIYVVILGHMFETGISDTIIALSTPPGFSAISVIRLSGKNAVSLVNPNFEGTDLTKQVSHTLHFGKIISNNVVIDEVVVGLFLAPKSYTKENVVEISCHGSPYIQQKIIELLIKTGARYAKPGEFTMRAFLNGRFDLAQAEAVADLIASETEAQQQLALKQLKGGFTHDLKILREQLIHFASLIELELDFAEEDVEFANREQLRALLINLQEKIHHLIQSFTYGNVVKNGVTTVIAGRPNAGKSTLLNTLLNEERAIVSEIAGTTRDVIEEKIVIDGILFRLIDTAGIREATDVIEKIGVEKTFEKIANASVLLYLFDASTSSEIEIGEDIEKLKRDKLEILLIANKADLCHEHELGMLNNSIREICRYDYPIFEISALKKQHIDELKEYLVAVVAGGKNSQDQTIVTNARHFQFLSECEEALEHAIEGLDNKQSGDFLAQDIRHALHALGAITGEITNEDILDNIFSKFCIGK
jgi:tRNA modification GTPase